MFFNASHTRKKTAELIAVQAYAGIRLSRDYSKNEVANLSKEYARLFVGGCAADLLDVLFSLIRQDEHCLQGQTPLVFPSNKTLCAKLNRCPSTIQKTLQALTKHLMIAYQDSGNCKRFKNDRTGKACGLDLTPMFERKNEIRQLLQQENQRRQLQENCSLKTAALKKSLQHCLDHINNKAGVAGFAAYLDACEDLQQQLKLIDASAMSVQERLQAVEILHAKAEEILQNAYFDAFPDAVEKSLKNEKIRPKGRKNSAHQYSFTSAYLTDVCTKPPARPVASRRAGRAGGFELATPVQNIFDKLFIDLKAYERETLNFQRRLVFENPIKRREHDDGKIKLNFQLVKSGLSHVEAEFGEFNSFSQLVDLMPYMKDFICLNQNAINQALKQHSFPYLAVCLAVTIEKVLRYPGKIENPAGYAVSLCSLSPDVGPSKLAKSLKALKKASFAMATHDQKDAQRSVEYA